jgi:hypothetical protein
MPFFHEKEIVDRRVQTSYIVQGDIGTPIVDTVLVDHETVYAPRAGNDRLFRRYSFAFTGRRRCRRMLRSWITTNGE